MAQDSGLKVSLRLLHKMSLKQLKDFTKKAAKRAVVRSAKAAARNPQLQKVVTLATVIELRDVGMSVCRRRKRRRH